MYKLIQSDIFDWDSPKTIRLIGKKKNIRIKLRKKDEIDKKNIFRPNFLPTLDLKLNYIGVVMI
jgi:hypothetical protein